MVDAARQMLDELMGRNRNLHPSEAPRKVNWDDPDFCQYHMVSFCPHDLFVNTRADMGPCTRIHDEEAKEMYHQARPGSRKRQVEDEFLRCCNSMLNEVDRKILKGKQRLQLMQRDQPGQGGHSYVSKYQEQLNNLNARIKKLLSEAEEAGIRGDVDQAKDLMSLCEQLREEKEALVTQHENNPTPKESDSTEREPNAETSPKKPNEEVAADADAAPADNNEKPKVLPWMQDLSVPEKQMEVCEVCGAFLIVGDAQQRIEDHLMGKQHLGYSRLRSAVEEIQKRREKEHEEDERKRYEERSQRGSSMRDDRMSRDRRDHFDRRGGQSRDHGGMRHHSDRNRRHSSNHRRRSRSRSNRSSHHHHRNHRNSRDSRSRSRSRY